MIEWESTTIPRGWHRVKGAGHNDLQEFDDYRGTLRAALDAL